MVFTESIIVRFLMPDSVLANYHTHTPRCQHAVGSEEHYIRTALQAGFTVLGFADHCPWPYRSGFVSNCRMLPRQLPDYLAALRALRSRYDGRLRLYIGLECEYYPAYMDWLTGQLPQLDYLILGNHFDRTDESGMYFGACTRPDEIQRYVTLTIAGMESGLYRYLAHPDLFLNHYPVFDKAAANACHALCEAAAALDLPLEYNLLGEARQHEPGQHGLGYTTEQFWAIAAQYPVKAIVGCDAHAPGQLAQPQQVIAAKQALRAKGLAVLDTLPGLE